MLTATILTGHAGADVACAPHVEEHPRWRSATLRAHTDAFMQCPVTFDVYLRTVRDWLAARAPDTGPLDSLFLGRAVRLPWLSRHLAEASLADDGWNTGTGRSRHGHENDFVGRVLSHPDVVARLDEPFAGSPYRVRDVSVEKVLVDRAGAVLEGRAGDPRRVAYDAQVWLRLEARR